MFKGKPKGKDLFELELHEEKLIQKNSSLKLSVMRVPGGFLYQKEYFGSEGGCSTSIEFVPYSEESYNG